MQNTPDNITKCWPTLADITNPVLAAIVIALNQVPDLTYSDNESVGLKFPGNYKVWLTHDHVTTTIIYDPNVYSAGNTTTIDVADPELIDKIQRLVNQKLLLPNDIFDRQ